MGKTTLTITSHQLFALLIAFTVGAGILTLPASGVEIMRDAGWLPVIVVGAVNIIAVFILVLVLEKFPPVTIHDFSTMLLGRFLGALVPLIIMVVSIAVLPIELIVLSDITQSTINQATPAWFIISTFTFVVCYLVDKGLAVIARVVELLFAVAMFIVFLVLVLSLRNLEIANLWPADTSLGPETPSRLLDIFFAFTGPILVLVLYPHLRKPEKVKSISVLAVATVLFIYVLFTVSTIGVFGPGETVNNIWPSLELAKSVHIRGAFIHRLDIIFEVLWLMALFTTTVGLLFAAVYIVLHWFKINQTYVIYGIGLAAAIAAMYFKANEAGVESYIFVVGLGGALMSVGLPVLFWIASFFISNPGKAKKQGKAKQQGGGGE